MQNPGPGFGQNVPPPIGAGGQSQGLAIASLVCGILSLICCNWFVLGIVALVLGFVAKSKASADPANFGGAGLALGGMITGGISLVLGVVVWMLYVFGFLAGVIGSMPR